MNTVSLPSMNLLDNDRASERSSIMLTRPFLVGFNTYCARIRRETLDTDIQRKGWDYAAKCEQAAIDAETEAYLEDIADREYWSRGQW